MSRKPILIHVSIEISVLITKGMAQYQVCRDQFIEDAVKFYMNAPTTPMSAIDRKIVLIDSVLQKQPDNPFAKVLNGIRTNTLLKGNDTTDAQDKIINETYNSVFGYRPISIIQKASPNIPPVPEAIKYLEHCVYDRLKKETRQDPKAQYDEARADLDCTYSYTPPGRVYLENRLDTIKKTCTVTPKIWNEISSCKDLPITYDDYMMNINEKERVILNNKLNRCITHYRETDDSESEKRLNDIVLEVQEIKKKYMELKSSAKYCPIAEYAKQAQLVEEAYNGIIEQRD